MNNFLAMLVPISIGILALCVGVFTFWEDIMKTEITPSRSSKLAEYSDQELETEIEARCQKKRATSINNKPQSRFHFEWSRVVSSVFDIVSAIHNGSADLKYVKEQYPTDLMHIVLKSIYDPNVMATWWKANVDGQTNEQLSNKERAK